MHLSIEVPARLWSNSHGFKALSMPHFHPADDMKGRNFQQRENDRQLGSNWENRALFATLSKGYPLTPEQIANFFITMYGNVVANVRMCNWNSDHAYVVLDSPLTVTKILNGRDTAKFKVRGCDLWVRQYVPSHVWANRQAARWSGCSSAGNLCRNIPPRLASQPAPFRLACRNIPPRLSSQPNPSQLAYQPTPSPLASQPAPFGLASRNIPPRLASQPTPPRLAYQPSPSALASLPASPRLAYQPTPSALASQPAPPRLPYQPTLSLLASQPAPPRLPYQPTPSPLAFQPAHSQPTLYPLASQPTPFPLASQPAPLASQPTPSPSASQPTTSPSPSQPTPSPSPSQQTAETDEAASEPTDEMDTVRWDDLIVHMMNLHNL